MTFNRALFSSASGEWETPQELFDQLDEEFHFSLDACASPQNAKCTHYFGLSGLCGAGCWAYWRRVWCNPPYGRHIGRWVEKGYKEAQRGCIVVMLLPVRPDTHWWRVYVLKALWGQSWRVERRQQDWRIVGDHGEIRFLYGRLKFSGHKNSAPFPSCIVVFRGE